MPQDKLRPLANRTLGNHTSLLTKENGLLILFTAFITPFITPFLEKILLKHSNTVLSALGLLDFKFESDETKDNHDIVLSAVKKNGLDLQFASERLRGDKEIVWAAVKKNGGALKFASESLRDDRDIVQAAVEQDGLAYKYAICEITHIPVNMNVEPNNTYGHFILYTLPNGQLHLRDNPAFINDIPIALAAIKQNPLAITFMNDGLKTRISDFKKERLEKKLQKAIKDTDNPVRDPLSYQLASYSESPIY